MAGPLSGYRIIEMAGLGPCPFAAMMLGDMGAEVIRVENARIQAPKESNLDVMQRNRRSIGLDLKSDAGRDVLMKLVDNADALIEGFRPGVMERLGAGPDECRVRNPRLVYGRMTGWGQSGPLAASAGHDLNYISLAGALAHFRRAGQAPVPPLNLVGDYGGGGMFLAYGIVCAILEAARSGEGQVVDASMVDGTAVLMSAFWGLKRTGEFDEDRPGSNLVDSGAHFYDAYECSDGKYVSIAAIEPKFYRELLLRMGLADDHDFQQQMDAKSWPNLKESIADVFRLKTRAQWCELLEGTDVCFAPVLTMSEASQHPHNTERGTFVKVEDEMQPAPAPRFSRTNPEVRRGPVPTGTDTRDVLHELGLLAEGIDELYESGAVR